MDGVISASKHIRGNVISIDSSFADVISTMAVDKALVFNYNPDQLVIDRETARTARNKTANGFENYVGRG